jgi:16S rRNA (guanine527-N7)-methyltransferase
VQPDYGPAAFAAEFDVPRGTVERFERYAALLADWQTRMNLVGPATIPDTWSRHFRDSAQLVRLAPPEGVWLDIGSGAGFPALVVAMLTGVHVHLVEATTKKCGFLRTVAEACGIANATIHNARIESLRPFRADVISARACASLGQLFAWGQKFSAPETLWLLPKGARHAEEIAEAEQRFSFDYTLVPSVTDGDARVIAAHLNIGKSRRR